MVTRSQKGIVKPIKRLSLHTSSVSPILKSPFLALKDLNWCNAMYDEYNALVKNGTWILVPRPTDANLFRSMWLFKHRFHADGTLGRYKARLVANDSSQHLVLGFSGLQVMPLGLVFPASRCDSSLFIYTQGSQVAYLLIYVDDIILRVSSSVLFQQIVDSLHKEFDMTDLEALNYFLGISTVRHLTGLFLSQKKYALQLFERAHMVNCNPSRKPADTDSKLGDNLLSWSAKRQHTISCSSVKAEYRGVANVVVETAWIRNLLRELHFVRDMVKAGHVRVLHVPSHFQYVDIFTKGLPSALFEYFWSSLSARPPFAQTARAY
nr:ribonuclease H-like domain-containing protein [Tanacetum cinerariifolium]